MCGFETREIYFPLLWSIFIEDLDLYLGLRPDSGLDISILTIILLLYADDIVVFIEIIEGLELQLDHLKSYCDRWGLKVNDHGFPTKRPSAKKWRMDV